MLCKELITWMEQSYPTDAALDWDNVGLLVGHTDKEIQKVHLALDATSEVIAHAVLKQVDLLITHHPMIFTPLKRVIQEEPVGNHIITLVENGISYYAMHTNYDVLRMGELVAQRLDLEMLEVLEVTQNRDGKDVGIGCLTRTTQPLTLEMCCGIVKEKFTLPHVKLFGNPGQEIQRIAICPGSGKSVIDVAVEKNAQVLITGDIGHHEGIEALDRGLSIIDAGHYGLEHIFMEDMNRFLKEKASKLIVTTETIQHPFRIL